MRITNIVADIRNKLTPFTNLSYMVDEARDMNAISNQLYAEAKLCRELTPIVKKLLEDIEKRIESPSVDEIRALHEYKPYMVKRVKVPKYFFGVFFVFDYQVIFEEDTILLHNLTAENATAICDALNGAYKIGWTSARTNL